MLVAVVPVKYQSYVDTVPLERTATTILLTPSHSNGVVRFIAFQPAVNV